MCISYVLTICPFSCFWWYYIFVWCINALFLFHTISHPFLFWTFHVKNDGSCSPYPGDQLYLLSFSFLLCALFLPLACSPLCLLLEILCVHSSFFLSLILWYLSDWPTKPLLCFQAFLPSFPIFSCSSIFLSNVLVFVTISLSVWFWFA